MSTQDPGKSPAAATDISEFMTDLDGGQFERMLSVALSQSAAAAVDKQKVAEIGLLLVVAVYMTRAVFIWLSAGWDQAVFFSLATVVIAGGSYMLEAAEPEGMRRG